MWLQLFLKSGVDVGRRAELVAGTSKMESKLHEEHL